MKVEEMVDTTQFFKSYYANARANSILVMQTDGTVLHVNDSFTEHFGYSNNDIHGKHFSVLFTEQDNDMGKPKTELETVLGRGQSYDENYVVNKAGQKAWCTGEALLDKMFVTQAEVAMLVLDGSLKVIKANAAFMHLFGLTVTPAAGTRLAGISHPFWAGPEIKQELSNILVHNLSFKHKSFLADTNSGHSKTIFIDSLTLDQPGLEKKIYLMIEK